MSRSSPFDALRYDAPMGMILTLYRVSAEAVTAIHGDDAAVERWLEADAAPSLDLDKMWDVLGRCLTEGDAAGLFQFVEGPIHESDLGYGPALGVSPAGVAAMRKAAEGVDAQAARAYLTSDGFRTDPPYPFFNALDADELDDEVTELAGLAASLRTFLDEAIAASEHLICVMT